MKTTAFANQKGGTGKTTLAHNTGRALADRKFRILMVDVDPQGNLTESLTEDKIRDNARTVCMYKGQSVVPVQITENLHLLAGDEELATVEHTNDIEVFDALRNGLSQFKDQFDLCLIDSPPSLGFLAISVYAATDYILVPLNPDSYSFSATATLLRKVQVVKSKWNPNLQILGVVLNNVKQRSKILEEASAELNNILAGVVFPVVIPSSVRMQETSAQKNSISRIAPGSSVERAFNQYLDVLIAKLNLSTTAQAQEKLA